MKFLRKLFSKPIAISKEEKDMLLRSLETKIEQLTPDFQFADEAKKFHDNPPEPVRIARSVYDKVWICKNGFKITTCLLFVMALTSCTHRSSLKHEGGVVIGRQFVPDTRQTVTGTGFSTSGHVVFTTHDIGQEEQFVIVFKCHHGRVFSINRFDLYDRLNERDTVDIAYYEWITDDAVVKDLEFIDARKINR